MVTCQICQHENPEGAEYCENCGAALPVAGTAASAASAPPAADAAGGTSTPAAEQQPAATPAGDSAGQTAPLTGDPDMDLPAEGDPAAAGSEASTAAPAAGATATATGQNPRLVGVRYGAPTGQEHPLLGARLVVGRFDAETGPVDIDLSQAPESEQISRQHAEIYRESDGQWYVKDLGSTNGVFVKKTGATTFGPRLTAPQPLTSGDEIGFGNARFIFQTD